MYYLICPKCGKKEEVNQAMEEGTWFEENKDLDYTEVYIHSDGSIEYGESETLDTVEFYTRHHPCYGVFPNKRIKDFLVKEE